MEMMLLSSAGEWARWGVHCDVLATAAQIGPLAERMRDAGYGVFHIPMRSRFRYLPRARFFSDYYRLCRSGYDVVHIHVEAAVPVFLTIAKMAGVASIALTPHNTFYFRGLLRARKFVERWLARLLGGRFGMISDGVMRCEWETYRNPGVRTWNWLDEERFRPATEDERQEARRSLGCAADQFVIVSVGNCNEFKNHPELLRAIALPAAPGNLLYLHVGREETHAPERALAQELGIAEKVRFCGSQEDIRPFLWAADAFVMPSLREGLGMTAIEAIASGTMTILSRVEGLSDIAAHAESPIFIGANAADIASALAEAAALPLNERRSRVAADSERIRHRFSVANGVRSIVEGLYAWKSGAVPLGSEEAAH